MARSELALAIARSTAPVPPPEGIVRVPLTGYVRVAPILGAYLGMFLAVGLFLLPPLSGLDPEIRRAVGPWVMILGTVPGFLVVRAIVAGRAVGRAIGFDARHVWIERRGEVADPLPWEGLRLRLGRIPGLVSPDGREIPFQREALGPGPDARYLAALVEALPKIEVPSRVPTWLLVAIGVIGFGLAQWAAGQRPPPEAEGPFWSPERFRFLGVLSVGTVLMMGALFAGLIRTDRRFAGRSVTRAPQAGDEIAAWFRGERFRPPATELRDGVTYGYRDPAFWRSGAKSQRDARAMLAVIGTLILLATIVAAFTVQNGRDTDRVLLVRLGVANFLFLGGIALFAPASTRDGWTIRVEGDRATVTDARGARSLAWPPARTHVAVEFTDWTDELRDGRRRIRFDRRLLVPIEA